MLANVTNINDISFINKVDNKKYFLYNLNKFQENSNNFLKTANIIYLDYTKEIPHSTFLALSDHELNKLPNNICHYFDYVNNVFSYDNVIVKQSEDDYFIPLWSQNYLRTFMPYGYISIIMNVYKHEYSSNSDLYIACFDVSFTPGKVAIANDETGYEDYTITSGYFHLEAMQAIESVSYGQDRLGGVPHFKDAYPTSSTGMVTITSSVNTGFTFGYSYDNGFSTSNGFSIQEGKTYGLSIDFGYSKAITIDDPILSTQISPTNSEEYQWSFSMVSDQTKEITYMLSGGYLFEIDKRNNQSYDDAIALRTNFRLNFYKKGWWIFGNDSREEIGFNTFIYP